MDLKTIYTTDVIARLELGWGPGWLSPGGSDDVAELIGDTEIAGKSVLDIGVGTGGPALTLLGRYSARQVTGIDVEHPVLDRARLLASAENLEHRLDLRRVSPGPLPFADEQFDVVFSKDSFVHIADKVLLFDEIFRVLAPGGLCLFSDWCCGAPPYSPEMERFLQNGMDFTMATADETGTHLDRAGFAAIAARDRSAWYADVAKREFHDAIGPKRPRMVAAFGADAADQLTATARRRAVIVAQGHLRPTHFTARKPG